MIAIRRFDLGPSSAKIVLDFLDKRVKGRTALSRYRVQDYPLICELNDGEHANGVGRHRVKTAKDTSSGKFGANKSFLAEMGILRRV